MPGRSPIEAPDRSRAKSLTKVLVITGRGRSGSTILDNLLGELDGFLSVGELHNIFKRGLLQAETCGCGRPVRKCELWSPVLAHTLGTGKHAIDPADVVAWQEEVARLRHLPRLMKQRPGTGSNWPALDAYTEVLGRLYRAIADLTGARVIVDSSKRPPHAAVVALLPSVRPYVVQLVRDPRAVAYSRQRVKAGVDRPLRQEGAFSNAVGWLRRNLASNELRRRHGSDRSTLVRYEDFAAHPQQVLKDIAGLVVGDPPALPFTGDRTATLSGNHAVSGNPSRFETGTVEIRNDTRWITDQSVSARVATTVLTLPLLLRYGYPLTPKDKAPHA